MNEGEAVTDNRLANPLHGLSVPLFFAERTLRVCWAFATFTVAWFVYRLKARLLRWPAERVHRVCALVLRRRLESLGATFIKFGQVLAMRPDFLPREYIDELSDLLDDVPPFPTIQAVEIIRSELGLPIDKLFIDFPPEPIAAASFGQVYKALLVSGELVAVKVQRPDIVRLVQADLRILRVLAAFIDASTILARLKFKTLYHDFEVWTNSELNYEVEARNANRIFINSRGHYEEVVPRIHWDYTTGRVLTMDFLEGVWVKDILTALNRGQKDKIRKYTAEGICLEQVAKNILRVVLRQVFTSGLFHADPHPANIVVLKDNRIGLVDFGITGFMGEEFQRNMLRLLEAMGAQSSTRAFEALVRILEPPRDVDLRAFRKEYEHHLQEWLGAVGDPRATLEEKSTARLLFGNLDIMRRHGLYLPSVVIRFYRALIILDSIILQLFPSINLTAEIRQFLTSLRSEQILDGLTAEAYFAAFLDYQRFMVEAPGLISQIAELRLFSEVLDANRRLERDFAKVRRWLTRSASTLVRLVGYGAFAGVWILLYLRVAQGILTYRIPVLNQLLGWRLAMLMLFFVGMALRWFARILYSRA
jgi:ubiquinone biosynthesis protein